MGKTLKEKGGAGTQRNERLAAELRANLKRRKARARSEDLQHSPAVRDKEKPN